MASAFSIQGLGELQAKLGYVAVKARAAAAEAVQQEVDAVGEDAEQGAPVRTGALRDGIERETSELDGSVTSTARHSTFVEHGTYKDPAQPFMAPAAERSRLRWPLRAAAVIRSAVEGI